MKPVHFLLVLLLLAIDSSAQSLETANSHLPRWVSFSGEYRARFEGFKGTSFRSGNDDHYLLNRYRLNIALKPHKWLKVKAQAQDSRVFKNSRIPDGPPYMNELDLRLAFGDLGDTEAGPVAIRVGRQEISLGDERILGSGNWANNARSFDAARLFLGLRKLRLSLFAGSVVAQSPTQYDHHRQGDNLHGITGNGKWRKVHFEPYSLWRIAPRARAESGLFGKADTKTSGLRMAGKFGERTEFVTEMVTQTGNWGADAVGSWAGHWRIIQTLATDKRIPKIRFEYDYARGDSDPRDGQHNTFELLYPTPHDKLGLADQVGWKNIHHMNATAEWGIGKTTTVQLKYHNWWLASARDGVYNAGGTLLARDVSGQSGHHVGNEGDLQVMTALTREIRLAGGVGHIVPGAFLQRTTPGANYTFSYLMLTWAF